MALSLPQKNLNHGRREMTLSCYLFSQESLHKTDLLNDLIELSERIF